MVQQGVLSLFQDKTGFGNWEGTNGSHSWEGDGAG